MIFALVRCHQTFIYPFGYFMLKICWLVLHWQYITSRGRTRKIYQEGTGCRYEKKWIVFTTRKHGHLWKYQILGLVCLHHCSQPLFRLCGKLATQLQSSCSNIMLSWRQSKKRASWRQGSQDGDSGFDRDPLGKIANYHITILPHNHGLYLWNCRIDPV
jgi:hypothetical protein